MAFDDISAALADDPAWDTFAYNDAHELTKQISHGTQAAYTYDDWGRTTTKITADTTEEYLYFAGSKLKTYKRAGATIANYNYDGFGKRRNKSDGTTTTWWRYDLGWNAIVEYDDADTDWDVETRAVSHTYTPGSQVGQALGQSAGTNPGTGAHGSYMQDHLGSTRGMLNDSDARVARVEYGPYGIMAVALGAVPGVLFTGKPWDEDVGMYAFPYRHYSPAGARWLTRDPLGMVDGPNMYAYVVGNPVGNWDPLGLTKWYELCKKRARQRYLVCVGLVMVTYKSCMWGCAFLVAPHLIAACMVGCQVVLAAGIAACTANYMIELAACRDAEEERCTPKPPPPPCPACPPPRPPIPPGGEPLPPGPIIA